MNVSELYYLTNWIKKEIVTTKIPQKYQTLQSILEQQSQPNQPKQPFENQKNDLIDTIKKVPLDNLTKDQLLYLEAFNIFKAVGSTGIDEIENILYKNVIDIATSAKKFQVIIQELNQGIQKSEQIYNGLKDVIIEEEYESTNEVLIRVCFTGNAAMSNIVDFKNWGNIWFDIGRGIAMANGASPEDVKVIGATKGSIIIELAVIASIATTVSGIILAALKVADKVLDLRKKAEEIRGLKLKNDGLAKEIEKEAENEKKSGSEEIITEIISKLNIKTDTEGDKITALSKAINNLVNFIEKGGEVDFVIPEENKSNEDEKETDQTDFTELRVAFQEIRKLEYKQSLIEHKKS